MTNYEILQKSIINAGINSSLGCWAMVRFLQLKTEPEIELYFQNKEYYAIIFDINFAKGFWGDERLTMSNIMSDGTSICYSNNVPKWEHYIQQMTLKKEPLKYVEQFLGEK